MSSPVISRQCRRLDLSICSRGAGGTRGPIRPPAEYFISASVVCHHVPPDRSVDRIEGSHVRRSPSHSVDTLRPVVPSSPVAIPVPPRPSSCSSSSGGSRLVRHPLRSRFDGRRLGGSRIRLRDSPGAVRSGVLGKREPIARPLQLVSLGRYPHGRPVSEVADVDARLKCSLLVDDCPHVIEPGRELVLGVDV